MTTQDAAPTDQPVAKVVSPYDGSKVTGIFWLTDPLPEGTSLYPIPPDSLVERTAQLIAHRACCGTEHDPANGKLHGYCVVCGVPWPCEYAGCRAPQSDSLAVAQALEQAAKVLDITLAELHAIAGETTSGERQIVKVILSDRVTAILALIPADIAAEAQRQAEDAKLGKRFRAYVAGSDLSPPTHEEKMSSGFDDWAEKEWTELQDAARGAK